MGPLKGVRVIELAGMGPGPHACMMLADMGADVLRIDRAENVDTASADDVKYQVLNRNRPNVAIDLKNPKGVELVLQLCEQADILIEGYRPGVIERLGLGPEVLLKRNPKLVIGRVTGWGQDGPLAKTAGHDINYISLTGALAAVGQPDGPPVIPLQFAGDFGGGSMLLLVGILAAYISAVKTGEGQVVDAAMIDGAATLMSWISGELAAGRWNDIKRGANLVDGGSHFYAVYETSDEKFIALGAIEERFYEKMIAHLGLKDGALHSQYDPARWPENRKIIAQIIKSRTRDEWIEEFGNDDSCVTPVLRLSEVMTHDQNVARKTFIECEGVLQPAPAPRFSKTVAKLMRGPSAPGEDTYSALKSWGYTEVDLRQLSESGAIRQAE